VTISRARSAAISAFPTPVIEVAEMNTMGLDIIRGSGRVYRDFGAADADVKVSVRRTARKSAESRVAR